MKRNFILILFSLLLIAAPSFSKEKPNQEDLTKKEIEKLLKRIKANRKKATDLIDEAKAIAVNLKDTAKIRLVLVRKTIEREQKLGKTHKEKIDEAIKIESEAKGLYPKKEYRKVIELANKALRLISTSPVIVLNISPPIFSPDNDGKRDIISFHMKSFAKDPKKVKGWKLVIKKRFKDKKKKSIEVMTFEGNGMPKIDKTIRWDGKKNGSLVVDSFNNYLAEMTITDNSSTGTSSDIPFMTDIFIEKIPYGMRVNVSAIQFDFNSYAIKDIYSDLLKRIKSFILEYPQYKYIVIEGHTDFGNFQICSKLSKDRADSVKRYLVKLGMHPSYIVTKGLGYSSPFTMFWNKRTMNRRVTFILLKNKEELQKYNDHISKIDFKKKPKFIY